MASLFGAPFLKNRRTRSPRFKEPGAKTASGALFGKSSGAAPVEGAVAEGGVELEARGGDFMRRGRGANKRRVLGRSRTQPTSFGVDEFLNGHADVTADFPQQRGRDVLAFVERDGRRAAVGMAELLVGAALADFDEFLGDEPVDDLARLEHRHVRHGYATSIWCVPTNSDSILGSPSSRSMAMTSLRLPSSSSRVAPWEWAPGKPGT